MAEEITFYPRIKNNKIIPNDFIQVCLEGSTFYWARRVKKINCPNIEKPQEYLLCKEEKITSRFEILDL